VFVFDVVCVCYVGVCNIVVMLGSVWCCLLFSKQGPERPRVTPALATRDYVMIA